MKKTKKLLMKKPKKLKKSKTSPKKQRDWGSGEWNFADGRTHHESCWRTHLDCAGAKVEDLNLELQELIRDISNLYYRVRV